MGLQDALKSELGPLKGWFLSEITIGDEELHGWPDVVIGCACGLGILRPTRLIAGTVEWECGFCSWRGELRRDNGQLVQR